MASINNLGLGTNYQVLKTKVTAQDEKTPQTQQAEVQAVKQPVVPSSQQPTQKVSLEYLQFMSGVSINKSEESQESHGAQKSRATGGYIDNNDPDATKRHYSSKRRAKKDLENGPIGAEVIVHRNNGDQVGGIICERENGKRYIEWRD